jgi:hypothetical protein
MKYVDLKKLQRKKDMGKILQGVKYYEDMRKELVQEDINWGQKTLCIDVENTLVRKVNIREIEELNMLKELTKYDDYIVINKSYQRPQSENSDDEVIGKVSQRIKENQEQLEDLVINYSELKSDGEQIIMADLPKDQPFCCLLKKQDKLCDCDLEIYQIRPYTFEILRAIQPFFEMIAMSYLPYNELEQIIDYIELMLNLPITEMLIKQAEERKMQKSIEGLSKSKGSGNSHKSKKPA